MRLTLNNVRLSFPHLFKPSAYKGGKSEPKYSCQLLMDPDRNADEIDDLEDAIEELIDEAFNGKKPKGMREVIKEGNDKEDDEGNVVDGYEDQIYVKASSKKPVPVVDADLSLLTEADGKPYGGCFVNAAVRLYAQDNDYGRHINVQLESIQFLSDGDPFGSGPVDPTKIFKKVKPKGRDKSRRRRRNDDDGDDII